MIVDYEEFVAEESDLNGPVDRLSKHLIALYDDRFVGVVCSRTELPPESIAAGGDNSRQNQQGRANEHQEGGEAGRKGGGETEGRNAKEISRGV
jgi:hypothetical protein